MVANVTLAQHSKKRKKGRLPATDSLIDNSANRVVIPQDTDNDGTPDSEDDCISDPGRKEFRGCPDSDKDGISNRDDACPDIKGVASAKGCPDRDGDGFADESDLCPDDFGASNQGCPPAKDSVELLHPVSNIDEMEAQVALISRYIQFGSANASIHPECFFALDTIVQILVQNQTLLVEIEGHTDNVGSSKQNILLSQQRADACSQYLISKGVSKGRILSSIGYGAMNPIADNNTYEGRSLNRRTEFHLKIGE